MQVLAPPPPAVTPTALTSAPTAAAIRGEPVQILRDAVPTTKQSVEKQRQDERARENDQRNGGRVFDARDAMSSRGSRGSQGERGSQIDILV